MCLLKVFFVRLLAAMFFLLLFCDDVCKNASRNISCPAGKNIQVVSACYGVQRYWPCFWSEDFYCDGFQEVSLIRSLCQDKPYCFITFKLLNERTKNPLRAKLQYIDINFTCIVPKEKALLEQFENFKPANAKELGNIENQIEEVLRVHPVTNETTYKYGDSQLHIIVANNNQKTYQTILDLGSSHIDFTLQTNNVSRIVATVFIYRINITESATQTYVVNERDLLTTQYIAIVNTTYIVIVGWDADSFLRSPKTTAGNNQLPGKASFVVSPASQESVCREMEKERKQIGNQMINKLGPVCVFYDPVENRYSDYGCITSTDDATGNVTCKCDHLTIFTVLLAVENISIPTGVKIISYTTESASIFFLLATIAIIYKYKRGDDRVSVQINLSVALLLLHAVNMSHDLAVLHEIPCVLFTVAVHYLLLCVGMWFLVEGLRLLMATSFPYSFEAQDPERRLKIFLLLGWIAPALLVGTAAGVGFSHDMYMKPQPLFRQCKNFLNQSSSIPKYDRCWLTPGTSIFYASIAAPLALVLFINFMIILKTTHVMFNTRRMHNRDGGPGENALPTAKSFFLLLVMLGVTWSLAFFTGIGSDISNELFMYINGVVNGSQGIVVFLLFCVMNHVIRQKILPCKSQANAVSNQQQLQQDTTNTRTPAQR